MTVRQDEAKFAEWARAEDKCMSIRRQYQLEKQDKMEILDQISKSNAKSKTCDAETIGSDVVIMES
ncbi:uncharacterized protein ColSpa_08273 [Colletotrichum spaethianum]|uniref:Uncharacterized protein n=1 Tax=Colletotrichum spaethianum TaxID=700344 RepID=A0AA37UQ43_9PEZI|nr:uncharacterized protein ColSpa_08273 [Colletotrichum spaethianum]GKT48092.1 hypothetical protein ColSpa_08273 [Colletotrichum spaethianum]